MDELLDLLGDAASDEDVRKSDIVCSSHDKNDNTKKNKTDRKTLVGFEVEKKETNKDFENESDENALMNSLLEDGFDENESINEIPNKSTKNDEKTDKNINTFEKNNTENEYNKLNTKIPKKKLGFTNSLKNESDVVKKHVERTKTDGTNNLC